MIRMLFMCAHIVVALCAMGAQTPCMRCYYATPTSSMALSAAGLKELSVTDCAFMTHQAMADIARCTSLTSLCIEQTSTVANRSKSQVIGVLLCMFHDGVHASVRQMHMQRKAWLTWFTCPPQSHIDYAQGTGSSSSMPVDRVRPFQTSEPLTHKL